MTFGDDGNEVPSPHRHGFFRSTELIASVAQVSALVSSATRRISSISARTICFNKLVDSINACGGKGELDFLLKSL